MRLGNILENPALDYWEQELGILITDRNEELLHFYENKMVGKLDGMCVYQGVKTVVENKISNSNFKNFTDNFGYILQCQAYMMATDTTQALLLGLQNGKPALKILYRDDDLIEDIKKVVDFAYGVLIGLEEFEDFPIEVTQKYNNVAILDEFNEVSAEDEEMFARLITLKAQKKALETNLKAIEVEIKERFTIGKFENENFKITLSNGTRKGSLNINELSIHMAKEGIKIDLDKFMNPPSTYQTIRTKVVK